MDENKEFEMNQEPVEEVTEAVEEAVEAVEEVVEIADIDVAEPVEAPQKNNKNALICVCAVVAAVVLLVVIGFATKILPWNKYNHMGYVNITGKTLAQIAEENDMELADLIEEYQLPKNMRGDTQESAAYYMMPVKRVAQMYGMDFEQMKTMLSLPDEITEDTPWGEAEGEITIENYVGADYFEDFKQEYGFGDEVTLETKWKDVRKKVDMASKKKYEEQKQEEADESVADVEDIQEESADETAETEETEAE